MAAEEETEEIMSRLKSIEKQLVELNAKKTRITNKISNLSAEKEELKDALKKKKFSMKQDTSEWSTKTFPWSTKLSDLLKEKFKFDEFRPKQLAAINATLSKKDVILIMPTGGGKSLVYQLPALVTKKITVIISPLISLIEDQLIGLKRMDISAATLNGNSSTTERRNVHDAMCDEKSQMRLLYVTPEWAAKSKLFMNNLTKCYSKGLLDRIVIDEVHCCSTWGHDFRPEYAHLGFLKSGFPDIPILCLTATATTKVLMDVQDMLSLEDALIISAPFNRPNLYYKLVPKPIEKSDCLSYLAKQVGERYKDQSGIIYTNTIKECEEITEKLRAMGHSVQQYHGSMEAKDKKKVHERWVKNKYQVIVATIAFGMGIDKPDVRFVIHHGVPKSMENLYQETGRAGRDGKKADCILMFSLSDFLKNVCMATSKTAEKNCTLMLEYFLEYKRCRRAIIAEHFDNQWDQSMCEKMCDNCKHPAQTVYNDITSAYKGLVKIITDSDKLTLIKLMGLWFKKSSAIETPTCSKTQAEDIISYLILKEYFKIEKGYTMYTNIAYIAVGRNTGGGSILMPYPHEIKGFKVNRDEPEAKKIKLG